MNFRELDPELVQELLERTDEKGNKLYADMLTPLVEQEETRFRHATCLKCGGTALEAVIDARRPFIPGSVLPNRFLRCLSCEAEFDAYTGLIRSVRSE